LLAEVSFRVRRASGGQSAARSAWMIGNDDLHRWSVVGPARAYAALKPVGAPAGVHRLHLGLFQHPREDRGPPGGRGSALSATVRRRPSPHSSARCGISEEGRRACSRVMGIPEPALPGDHPDRGPVSWRSSRCTGSGLLSSYLAVAGDHRAGQPPVPRARYDHYFRAVSCRREGPCWWSFVKVLIFSTMVVLAPLLLRLSRVRRVRPGSAIAGSGRGRCGRRS